jgi:rhamnosyltransferase
VKNQSTVAVLLAAYNGQEWIVEQLSSILKQKGIIVTVYVSVDLSTDGTYELLQKLTLTHVNIKVLPYGERYGGAASNFFRLIRDVDFSSFDYVAFSDQDDIWFDWKLRRAISMLDDSGSVAYSSDMTAFWPDGREQILKKSYKQCKYDHFFESPGAGCTFVFETKVLHEFKLEFNKICHLASEVTANHDWYLYAYVRQKGFNWYIDECTTMKYRQHSNNEMGINSGFKSYLSRLKMVKNHWYKRQVKLVLESFCPELKPKLLNRFYLIFNFYKLRRRPRDRIALLIMLLFGLF